MGIGSLGDQQESAEEKRAWWFLRTASGKTIWPGKKYVHVKVFYDSMGRPPIHGLHWDRIYTPNEYLVQQLTQDQKKELAEYRARFTGR